MQFATEGKQKLEYTCVIGHSIDTHLSWSMKDLIKPLMLQPCLHTCTVFPPTVFESSVSHFRCWWYSINWFLLVLPVSCTASPGIFTFTFSVTTHSLPVLPTLLHSVGDFWIKFSVLQQRRSQIWMCSLSLLSLPVNGYARRETLVDPTLQAVIQVLRTDKWQQNLSNVVHVDSYKSYRQLQDELSGSVDGDTILRGHRLIIPAALQTNFFDLAHEGHN